MDGGLTMNIDEHIRIIDNKICKNIEMMDASARGILSQNILSDLRNLVEYTSLKAFSKGSAIDLSYDNIKAANHYVKTISELNFLNKFHKLLQISTSHYTLDEDSSERLMLKYYEHMLKIKNFLDEKYGMEILSNIHKFPNNMDSNLLEYYEKIAEKISHPSSGGYLNDYRDRYYIHKVKPFFINQKIYYEVTFTAANERTSKFDRIIAFTDIDIISNYAVKLSLKNDNIDILGKKMPIQIIEDFEVSIRPCELNNFARIFGIKTKISTGYREYKGLMRFISTTGMSLSDFIDTQDSYYNEVKSIIIQKVKTPKLFEVLDKCRDIVKKKQPGSNILKYLLYRLNNKIIKSQISQRNCHLLSDLYLDYKCIPFDQMPFNSSPKDHNPRLIDLFDCLDITGREHELFARLIKNNTEIEGQLYTSKKDITDFENIDELINEYNNKLYSKHQNRKIEEYRGNLYIKGYEDDTVKIIENLTELSAEGIDGYSSSVEFWLQNTAHSIDCEEKKTALKNMFEHSKVALIYGAAGTGKTTIINHISNFFNDEKKIYIANTNPAVENLKRKVQASNCSHYTVAKFLSYSNYDTDCDMLIIDECSTVSNRDMRAIINKSTFRLLVLVGDVFQIESIRFGNWFNIASSFIPKTSVFELKQPYRSKSESLLNVWGKVRRLDEDILEHITRNRYSSNLDESIFEHTREDEIILCLNYDGLYGINNINKFLQGSNPNKPVPWGVQIYKIGDPILFNETNRFHPLIYNNSKGKIVDIQVFEREIQFDIQLDRPINEFQSAGYDFELINESGNPNSIIRFSVNKYKSTDEDDDGTSDDIVPFQVAYAISIHKAQGLEYKSVKVVITDEFGEQITHNIFYTAITRAREKLKIYWTPETENKILKNFNKKMMEKDKALLSAKNNLRKIK